MKLDDYIKVIRVKKDVARGISKMQEKTQDL